MLGAGQAKRLGRAIIVTEVALALVLVASGGLLARSFHVLTTAELGFETGAVAAFAVTLASDSSGPERHAFQDRLVERITGRTDPGDRMVTSAA